MSNDLKKLFSDKLTSQYIHIYISKADFPTKNSVTKRPNADVLVETKFYSKQVHVFCQIVKKSAKIELLRRAKALFFTLLRTIFCMVA